jgi:hypothetical protein
VKLQPRELTARHILRDGVLLAVLRLVDHGHVSRVIAELFRDGADGRATDVRPYTFRDHHEAVAFVEDAVGTFTHLGCQVRELD